MATLLSKLAWIGVHYPKNHLLSSPLIFLPSYSSFFVLKFIHGLSFKCARVGGVEIPDNKRVEYSLQYIHGIGRARARQILCDVNIYNKKTYELSAKELVTLRDEVNKYLIGGDLRRFNALNIKRLENIKCFRGLKHVREEELRKYKEEKVERRRKKRALIRKKKEQESK
ncbi:Ribosomal protein S13 [Macleaya cordata]|uniref:Ribosomal protein S13 n=1 Tax=Macleaya cordata TaxID=56857 RepID=A0A200QXD6_MACCD|nr:Ribosomal protein S13 [Macleaya cordata]